MCGKRPVDWQDEINAAVDLANEALDLRTRQALERLERAPVKPKPVPEPAQPSPPSGPEKDKDGTVSDRVFMEALRRRRERRQIGKFEL